MNLREAHSRSVLAASLLSLLFWAGCRVSYPHSAIIDDEIAVAPRATPPIKNDLNLTLTEIDGQPISRERIFLEDAWPGAVADPGVHKFKVVVSTQFRGPNSWSHEATISATVEAGKRYALVSDNGNPSLLEYRPYRPH